MTIGTPESSFLVLTFVYSFFFSPSYGLRENITHAILIDPEDLYKEALEKAFAGTDR